MTNDPIERTLKPGSRVRWKRRAVTGTVLAMPGMHNGPGDLHAVLDDEGELYAVHETLLEPLDGDGFTISRQVLHAKRATLFDEMTRILATAQNVDLADPAARRQVEDQVTRMSRSWGDADGTRLRKGLSENPELRRRFVQRLTEYLEIGELIEELTDS